MLEEIENLLNDQVRPALASHGGGIEIVDLDSGVLYIKLFGGCQGCSSSKATVKQGIEVLLKQKFDSITEVIDVTDHQAGDTPYM